MTEEFRPILGYEGIYEVSSFGRVKSLPRKSRRGVPFGGYILKHNDKAYPTVTLCKDGTRRTRGVHVIVCEAFHGSPPINARWVAHWDGNPKNNSADNLRWATQSENKNDEKRHGTFLHGETGSKAKLTNNQAIEIRELRKLGMTYDELAATFGVAKPTIADIVTRRHFRFIDVEAALKDAGIPVKARTT